MKIVNVSKILCLFIFLVVSCSPEGEPLDEELELVLKQNSQSIDTKNSEEILDISYLGYRVPRVRFCQCLPMDVQYDASLTSNRIKQLRKAWLYMLNEQGTVYFNYAVLIDSEYTTVDNQGNTVFRETWLRRNPDERPDGLPPIIILDPPNGPDDFPDEIPD